MCEVRPDVVNSVPGISALDLLVRVNKVYVISRVTLGSGCLMKDPRVAQLISPLMGFLIAPMRVVLRLSVLTSRGVEAGGAVLSI